MAAGRFTAPPNDGQLIDEWLGLGADFDRDVLPTVRRVSQSLIDGGRGPFKLRAFDAAIREKVAADQAEVARLASVADRIRREDERQFREQDEQREAEERHMRKGSAHG